MAARTFTVIFQRAAGGKETATVYVDQKSFKEAWEVVRANEQVYFAEAYVLKHAVPIATKVTGQTCDKLPEPQQDPPRIAGTENGGPFR